MNRFVLAALLLFSCSSQATTYYVLQNVSAVQSAPANGALPNGSQVINPSAGQGAINPQSAVFQCIVAGTSGNVSATIQPLASNDGINWINYGTSISIASGPTPQQGSNYGTSPWQFYSAYVTAISGTGAKVTCLLGV